MSDSLSSDYDLFRSGSISTISPNSSPLLRSPSARRSRAAASAAATDTAVDTGSDGRSRALLGVCVCVRVCVCVCVCVWWLLLDFGCHRRCCNLFQMMLSLLLVLMSHPPGHKIASPSASSCGGVVDVPACPGGGWKPLEAEATPINPSL